MIYSGTEKTTAYGGDPVEIEADSGLIYLISIDCDGTGDVTVVYGEDETPSYQRAATNETLEFHMKPTNQSVTVDFGGDGFVLTYRVVSSAIKRDTQTEYLLS